MSPSLPSSSKHEIISTVSDSHLSGPSQSMVCIEPVIPLPAMSQSCCSPELPAISLIPASAPIEDCHETDSTSHTQTGLPAASNEHFHEKDHITIGHPCLKLKIVNTM